MQLWSTPIGERGFPWLTKILTTSLKNQRQHNDGGFSNHDIMFYESLLIFTSLFTLFPNYTNDAFSACQYYYKMRIQDLARGDPNGNPDRKDGFLSCLAFFFLVFFNLFFFCGLQISVAQREGMGKGGEWGKRRERRERREREMGLFCLTEAGTMTLFNDVGAIHV